MTGRNFDFKCTLVVSWFENKLFELYISIMSCTRFRVNPHSILYNCLNVKELLAQNRHGIWSLSGCNRTQIYNHLVCKRTLNHLAKLVWLNGSVFIYKLSGCGFKSCCSHLNFLNIYQVSKFQVFMETNGSFPYSFVVSNLHLETNGSWFESNW